MGTAVVCPKCKRANGLLHEYCLNKEGCNTVITRSGKPSIAHGDSKDLSTASWETENISGLEKIGEIIQAQGADSDVLRFAYFDAHDFFRYCLLLRAMKEQFDKDDKKIWFNDCLFFLRGGYNFYEYLKFTSTLSVRGRIFGGLNHGRNPRKRVASWLARLLAEAHARGHKEVDVFIADEINSGSGTHFFLKLIHEEIKNLAKFSQISIYIRFHFYLACTDDSKFNASKFCQEAQERDDVLYMEGSVMVENHFRLFRGPLITYDEDKYSGLSYIDRNLLFERYKLVRIPVDYVRFVCPATKKEVFGYGAAEDSLSKIVILSTLTYTTKLLGDTEYELTRGRIDKGPCDECRLLFSLLRAPANDMYTSTVLCAEGKETQAAKQQA